MLGIHRCFRFSLPGDKFSLQRLSPKLGSQHQRRIKTPLSILSGVSCDLPNQGRCSIALLSLILDPCLAPFSLQLPPSQYMGPSLVAGEHWTGRTCRGSDKTAHRQGTKNNTLRSETLTHRVLIFFQIKNVKTYRYRCRSVIISN